MNLKIRSEMQTIPKLSNKNTLQNIPKTMTISRFRAQKKIRSCDYAATDFYYMGCMLFSYAVIPPPTANGVDVFTVDKCYLYAPFFNFVGSFQPRIASPGQAFRPFMVEDCHTIPYGCRL